MFGSPARFSCSVPWFSGMHSADSSWFSPEKIGPMILSIPYVRSLSWALFSVLTLPFTELQRDATDAGEIGGDTRKMIEQRMKKSVVSPKNYFDADKAQQQTVTKKGTRRKQASLPSSMAEQTEGKNEGGEPEQKTLF